MGAASARAVCVGACSARARAKSEQRANRCSGVFASAADRTGSSAASSGRVHANAGGGESRWWLMTTGIGMREELRSGEEVIGGRGKGVLIGATIDLLTHQLLGRGVGHGDHCHIGGGKPADVVEVACDPEVGQQDSLLAVVVIEMGEWTNGSRRTDCARPSGRRTSGSPQIDLVRCRLWCGRRPTGVDLVGYVLSWRNRGPLRGVTLSG